MLVAAIVLFCVSSLLVVAAVGEGKRHQRLYLTETMTTATVAALHEAALQAAGPNTFSQAVDLSGTAAAGQDGLIQAQLTGRSCVWHQHLVTRTVVETVDGKEQSRQETVSQLSSQTPFALRDAEGTLTVVPTTNVDHAELLLDETIGDQRRQEWVLAEGTQIYVHGAAVDRDGVLTVRDPDGKDSLVISTRTEQQVLASSLRSRTGFFIAAGVFDLAGLGFLVAWLSR